jgi:hypothetical protein
MTLTSIPKIAKPITKMARMIRIKACAKGLVISKNPEDIQALKKALLELEPNPKVELREVTTYSVEVNGICIRLLKDKEEAANLALDLKQIIEESK